jgi:hypothetical protein
MWNLISVRLDTELVSVQDRCMVCVKRTIGLEIISGCSFYSVWNGANLDVRYVHGLHRTYHRLGNHFGHT